MKPGTLARVALLTMLSIVGGATAYAQLQSGRILGTVFDPQKAGIPGATVTVTNLATNIARTAVTDSEGNYVITPLDPGTYSVAAEVPGFQKAVREGLVLTVGQSARVELSLNLGSLSTEVQVVAEVPLLNTESATLSQVITNEQIVDLPLNGRGFHELARLTSGVALLPPTGNTQPVRPEVVNGNVIGGVAGAQTRFLLDGVDITEEHQGGTWIQTSVDALQEFSVQQNAYSAEFHGAGATFNVTTKSGGNAFHGSLFEFVRNDKFDSKNFFALNKEKLERNQFGGTLGGPVMIPGMYDGRNKSFFFASYEGHRRTQGIVDVSNVPSAAQRQGDFRGLAPVFDPLTTTTVGGVATRSQFADNMIPQNRISPQALYFMKYIPLPNAAGNTYVSNPITSFNANQMTLRFDQEINQQNRLFARYSRHVNAEDRQDRWDTLGATRLEGPAYNVALALTSNFGSSLVHEVRFSRMYGEYRSTAYFQGQGVQLVQQQAGIRGLEGIQDPNIASLPAFSISGYQGFSGNAGDGRPKWQDRGEYELTDNLTWIKGRHILKFGGRMYHRNILFTDARSHNGSFNFTGVMTQRPVTSAGTGVSFADYLLGYPASVTRSNPATWWGGSGTYWHGFFQDDFRLTNNLTLNLGLRYEYTPWLTAYRNQGAVFDPTRAKSIIVSSETDQIDLGAQALADVGMALFGDLIQTSSQAGVPLQLTANDTKQLAPRAGFAYRLGDRTVVRGGYGMFYEAEGTSGRLNFHFLPFSMSETVNATTNVVPNRTMSNFFLDVPFGASVGTVGWNPLTLDAEFGFDQRWNIGVQQEIANRMSLEVNYVGTKGTDQQESEPINIPAPGPGAIQQRRPYPRFGNMNIHSQARSSEYHALQTKLQKRTSGGFWYLVSHTWSKTLTTVPAPGIGGNFTYDTGPAGFDTPHLLAASFGAELPFGRGRRFLGGAGTLANAFVGGWQAQSIVNYRGGLPYTPGVSRDVANTGAGGQRPNRIGDGALDNPTIDAWFDKTAFVVPPDFAFGNTGRGILRGDHQWNVDFSLFKRFSVGGSRALEFRAEAFNLLNSVYFDLPNTAIDTAAGGRITGTSNSARSLQFGLKLIF
jgi:Carboxypeptidase regulatory-like domain